MTIVRVSTDHGEATWEAGRFQGHPIVVRNAAYAAQHHLTVIVGQAEMVADGYNAMGAATALFAHNPGRTNLLEAPAEVLDFIQSVTGDTAHELVIESDGSPWSQTSLGVESAHVSEQQSESMQGQGDTK